MTLPMTRRYGFPLLSAGQAQKELVHNEALLTADCMMNPVVEERERNDPPATPIEGQAWIIGNAPTGDWAGHAAQIAFRTAGGWRFTSVFDGLHIWIHSERCWAVRTADTWAVGIVSGQALHIGGEQVVGPRAAAIAEPVGGSVVDAQVRVAVSAILAVLKGHGLISE